MKKMLILMLVLGVVPVASAAVMTLQISVGGVNEPPDSTINLLPSQSVELDVWTPNGWQSDETDNVYFGLVLTDQTAGLATITGGVAHIPPAPDLSWMLNPGQYDPFFPGQGGVYGQIMSSTGVAGTGVYFDQILFHCEGPGDAVLQLWSSMEEGVFVLQDTVIIHQVPEPATMVLLSLGGLLFRKRGK